MLCAILKAVLGGGRWASAIFICCTSSLGALEALLSVCSSTLRRNVTIADSHLPAAKATLLLLFGFGLYVAILLTGLWVSTWLPKSRA